MLRRSLSLSVQSEFSIKLPLPPEDDSMITDYLPIAGEIAGVFPYGCVNEAVLSGAPLR
jgi:hypothetical protein